MLMFRDSFFLLVFVYRFAKLSLLTKLNNLCHCMIKTGGPSLSMGVLFQKPPLTSKSIFKFMDWGGPKHSDVTTAGLWLHIEGFLSAGEAACGNPDFA